LGARGHTQHPSFGYSIKAICKVEAAYLSSWEYFLTQDWVLSSWILVFMLGIMVLDIAAWEVLGLERWRLERHIYAGRSRELGWRDGIL
jgi:hypothetical protein